MQPLRPAPSWSSSLRPGRTLPPATTGPAGVLLKTSDPSTPFGCAELSRCPPLAAAPSVWVPATTLLLSYTAEQAGVSIFAAHLLLTSFRDQPWGVSAGLATVAAISAALIYENALLAGGRFIGQVRGAGIKFS